MKLPRILFAVACLFCFFSCGSKKNDPQNPIVGKWTLQQQHVVMNEDNAKIVDTVFTASNITYGAAQFNTDGSFSSSATYNPGNTSLTGPTPSNASSNGTYTYSSTAFSISPGLSGWFTYVTGSSGAPVNVSYTYQVTTLNANTLVVHSTNTFTITNSTGQHTFNQVSDMSYTK